MNICRDCKHLVGGKEAPFLCGKKKRTPAVDPITGEKGFTGDIKLGRASLNQDEYERCEKLNPEGKCEVFEKKS